MNDANDLTGDAERVAHEAAAWVLRGDRRLTPAEQDEFSAWLAADPRHGAQLARHRHHWRQLDRLGQWLPEHSERPNPDLLAPPLRRRLGRFIPVVLPLAAAAAIIALALIWFQARPSSASADRANASAIVAAPSERTLPDGSIVALNRGAEVAVDFSAAERRVQLKRGEAHFVVTKDATRPFVVTAEGVTVRAVGTAFNVRLDSAAVEVLVTEGQVALARDGDGTKEAGGGNSGSRNSPSASSPAALLSARQRAVVSRSPATAPQIATLTPGEIERVLAWQHRLLDFTAAPLAEIVAAFNRRNAVQLVLADSELAVVRISAAFRSDNVAGFVHLLEAGFGVRAERRGETEIVLRKIP